MAVTETRALRLVPRQANVDDVNRIQARAWPAILPPTWNHLRVPVMFLARWSQTVV